MTAPIFIETRRHGGFSGLGSSAEEQVMMETIRAATAVKTRRIMGVASVLGGAAVTLTGLFSKSAIKWPTAVLGLGVLGAGGYLLANVQSEKVFFWEDPASPA